MDWKLDDGRPIWPQLAQLLTRRIIAEEGRGRAPSWTVMMSAGMSAQASSAFLTECQRVGPPGAMQRSPACPAHCGERTTTVCDPGSAFSIRRTA